MTQFYDFKIENIKDLSIEERKLRKKNLDLFNHNGFPNKKDRDSFVLLFFLLTRDL